MTATLSSRIVDDLVGNDIGFVTTVPCKQLAGVIGVIEKRNDILHVPSNKEDEGMGLCAGAFMGGKRALYHHAEHRHRGDDQHPGDLDPVLSNTRCRC